MKDHDIELLKKFLDRRCSDEEQADVQMLLQQEESQHVLEELIAAQSAADWNATSKADPEQQPLINRWKLHLQQRIAQEAQNRSKRLRMHRWRQVAAVIVGVLFMAGVSFVGYKQMVPKRAVIEQRNTGGGPIKYVLPDSTSVYLAAGSELRYPAQFSGGTREIHLNGEAFFDVTPDATKPFVIHTGNVRTRVLGTSFRVTAFDSTAVEVAVASGRVQVTDHQSEEPRALALLTKGQKVHYDAVRGSVRKGLVDAASLENWASGEVYFDGQELDKILASLQRIYGVAFRLEDPRLAAVRLNATFSATEPLDDVMEMLAFVGKFTYRYDSQQQVMILYHTP
ncbi:FecR family protein [Sphingobacterium suaedae]|uniref:FecR family protein n=1 Tax=Sphingobacterium suaedae TaxID=1686402 RepID=A0ABW5KP26_9SPHI